MTSNTNPRTESAFNQELARIAVGAYDDSQDVRKSMMNRIRDVVRRRNEDINFDEVEDKKEDQSYDSKYNDDNLPDLIEDMRANGEFSDREFEYLQKMLEAATVSRRVEKEYENVMKITKAEPIWTEWLVDVTGVSHTLTSRLINQFGYCEDFDRVSNLWSYAGLAPGQKRERGEKLSYNPDAKVLAWKISDTMIKMGANSKYRTEFYDPYKEKQLRRKERAADMTEAELEAVKWTPPESQGHADNRARRYLGKKFLKHYWAIARDLQGLETPDEWVIAHGGHEKQTETFENPFFALRYYQND